MIYDKDSTFKKRASCKCRGTNKRTCDVLAALCGIQIYLRQCWVLADQQVGMQWNTQF
jgi:hypothetical protein